MNIRKTCITSLAWGSIALACSTDNSDESPLIDAGTGSQDVEAGASSDVTDVATITSVGPIDIPSHWEISDAGVTSTTDSESSDASTDVSTVADAAIGSDTATSSDGDSDGGVDPETSAFELDAAVDSGFGNDADAQVYVPDAGVFRPEELPFEESYLDQLSLPNGFGINVFAAPGGKTRMVAENNGAIYVTRPDQGDVLRLVDNNADGVSDQQTTAIAGYPTIHGITFNGDEVYLATTTELIRATVSGTGTFTAAQVLANDLPDGGQHALRTIGIGPDGFIYLSIGSSCDACAEPNPEHATMLRVAMDGSSRSVFARGLRNTIGFGWQPDTNQLWGMDHGSDWRGNDVPPEELNLIEEGNDYGWPYCYGKRELDPVIGDPINQTQATYCSTTTPSVLENQAHQAPIGLTFYAGTAFPEEYRGDAFVAMRGSWNRIPATGYKVVRIVFDAGQPIAIEDFVTGFLNEPGTATFGRPAGITVDPVGALIFTDDTNGVLYRVRPL